MRRTLLFTLLALSIFAFMGCTQGEQYIQESGSIFHTEYHFTYKSEKPLTREIAAELERFNKSLNPFDSLSVVTSINENRSFETDSLFRNCFRRAQEIARLSDGAFDVTSAPLINAWGFGFKSSDLLTPEQIDSLRAFVGYEKVQLDGNTFVKQDDRTMLNLSAIAKGYATDVVAELLRSKGVEDFMIEIGGEIAYAGLNPKGVSWRIGIDSPMDESGVNLSANNFQCIISLPAEMSGMATSGNYRNFYIKDGEKYAHTIDPRTAYPVQTDVLSATVIASDAMTADALATTFMVVGSVEAQRIAALFSNVEYYLVCSQGEGATHTKTSPGFESLIVRSEERE